jgi:putative ABC transport system ATP-binding protein
MDAARDGRRRSFPIVDSALPARCRNRLRVSFRWSPLAGVARKGYPSWGALRGAPHARVRQRHKEASAQLALITPGDNDTLINLSSVVKTYDTGEVPFTALKGVDLSVSSGEFVGLIGKSGSGKTTLINMITGIDRPTSGEVLISGTPVHSLSENKLAVWRGRTIGVVFQFFQLLPTLTVVENVMLPMDFCNVHLPRERESYALELLDQVEMADQAHKLPSALSGGQQQRVAIARALANDPPILAADEPTGNLDSVTAESVFELFEKLVDGGKTIVMVTHDNDIAARVARALHVLDGEIVDDIRRDT